MTAVDHTRDVDRLTAQHRFACMVDTDELYVYVDGVYRPNGEPFIKAWCETEAQGVGISARRDYVAEIVAAVRRRSYTNRDQFNPPGKLCLLNGVLDIGDHSFGPHTPDVPFTVQLPIAYEEAATCPAFEAFVREVLPDEDGRETIRRLFGYALEYGNPFQRAFMWYGSGNNGKTTLANVLVAMLGNQNVSSVPLQDLSDHRFAAASLWGKVLNLSDDLPKNPMRHSGVFKELTGESWMQVEKKFRDPFSFRNGAKLVFVSNVLPQVNDDSYAFWRRWILVDFHVDVSGRVDPHLLAKLTAELPGILNWSLAGLEALREAKGFPTGGTVDALKERWARESNPLRWFVAERVRTDKDAYVPKDALYEAYVAFCDEHDKAPKTREQLATDLRNLVPTVRSERRRCGGGTREQTWVGIGLVTPAGKDETAPDEAGQTSLEDTDQGDHSGQGDSLSTPTL